LVWRLNSDNDWLRVSCEVRDRAPNLFAPLLNDMLESRKPPVLELKQAERDPRRMRRRTYQISHRPQSLQIRSKPIDRFSPCPRVWDSYKSARHSDQACNKPVMSDTRLVVRIAERYAETKLDCRTNCSSAQNPTTGPSWTWPLMEDPAVSLCSTLKGY
jgi:hypothetical protein